MFWIVIALIVLWFFGLLNDLGGGLIHLLLVIALIVFIYRLATDRKPRI